MGADYTGNFGNAPYGLLAGLFPGKLVMLLFIEKVVPYCSHPFIKMLNI